MMLTCRLSKCLIRPQPVGPLPDGTRPAGGAGLAAVERQILFAELDSPMARRTRNLIKSAPAYTRAIVFDSDLGWIAAAWRDESLCALTFGHATRLQAVRALGPADANPEAAAVDDPFALRVQAYAQGSVDDFRDLPIELRGCTAFAQRVLRRCRQIPYGQTLSYAQLAAAVGSPQAARAVGNVMAHNRIPLVIPCHRVVGAGGGLGGYSAPGGVRVKRRLLAMERQ